jgi:methyl-accepting chemotaxis protein
MYHFGDNFMYSSIQLKIALTFIILISIILMSNAIIINSKTNQWFTDAAMVRLRTGSNIVISQIEQTKNQVKLASSSAAKNATLQSNLVLLSELLKENAEIPFDDAYIMMSHNIASHLKTISDQNANNRMALFDTDGNLIAFYKAEQNLLGWLKGNSKHNTEVAGNEKKISTTKIASEYKKIKYSLNKNTLSTEDNLLSIDYASPIFDEYDATIVIGYIVSSAFLNEQYSFKASLLAGTQVNFYIKNQLSTGTVKQLKSISIKKKETRQERILNEAKNKNSNHNILKTGSDNFYFKFLSLKNDDNTIGYVATLLSTKNADKKIKEAEESLLYIFFGSILFGGAISLLFSLFISSPLKKLALNISLVEKTGDFSIRSKSSSNDEVGKSVFAFNRLIESLEKVIKAINHTMGNVSNGDLTCQLKGESKG